MTNKLSTENRVRLVLDKVYIDGYKSGGSGLGYSKKAFDQIMEILEEKTIKVFCVQIQREFEEDNFIMHYRSEKKMSHKKLIEVIKNEHYIELTDEEIYHINHYEIT